MEEVLVLNRGQEKPTTAVILMHGLGANAHDFEEVVKLLPLDSGLNVRFILPNAPLQPVTLNGGMIMRSWYDIANLDFDKGRADVDGVHESVAIIRELITQQVEQGICHDKIILAGFSQGGALALATGLTYDEKLAGILALSTYLPISEEVPEVSNISPEIMVMHGVEDQVVGLQYAENSRDYLKSLGYQVAWKTYPMGHSVCEPQIKDIADWINQQLQ